MPRRTSVSNPAGVPDSASRFDGRRQVLRRALQQQFLHTTVLVAKLDFQVMHRLAVAHEAEVARLDHAGVDRPNADFVHFPAAHSEERVLVHALLAGALETHRLEPRMAAGQHAGLFPQLALVDVRRRMLQGQRRVGVALLRRAAQDGQAVRLGHEHRRHRDGSLTFPTIPAEQGKQPLALGEPPVAFVDEIGKAQRRGFAQVIDEYRILRHLRLPQSTPPRRAAAVSPARARTSRA